MYTKIGLLLDSELSVLCDSISKLRTGSIVQAPVVVFQQNCKIGYGSFVFGIKFLRGAEGRLSARVVAAEPKLAPDEIIFQDFSKRLLGKRGIWVQLGRRLCLGARRFCQSGRKATSLRSSDGRPALWDEPQLNHDTI